MKSVVFGPVPSRRLGRSLGINNLPTSACTYSSVYGPGAATAATHIEREPFVDPELIAGRVAQRLAELRGARQPVDHVTFAPTGEPTLDLRLGETIAKVRRHGARVAVMTNGSLLWRHDVRQDVARADIVSITVDAARRECWREVDRPAPQLRFEDVMAGIRAFAESYRGKLLTQTTLVGGMNDSEEEIEAVADYLQLIKPGIAYLAVASAPGVPATSDKAFTRAYAALADHVSHVACLLDEDEYDMRDAPSGADGLMARAAERPIERQEVETWLQDGGYDWGVVQELVDGGALRVVEYRGRTYFSPRRRA